MNTYDLRVIKPGYAEQTVTMPAVSIETAFANAHAQGWKVVGQAQPNTPAIDKTMTRKDISGAIFAGVARALFLFLGVIIIIILVLSFGVV
jgi:uncharacterized protein (DUF2062 family)